MIFIFVGWVLSFILGYLVCSILDDIRAGYAERDAKRAAE